MIGTAGFAYYRQYLTWPARGGTVTFETAPAGVDVFVSGKNVGRTPTTVRLPVGTYDVRLGMGEHARTLNVDVAAGASIVQHFEMAAAAPAPAPIVGSLQVQTDPARQVVLLDGVEQGTSPVTLDKVAPGDHELAIRGEQGLVKRAVHVTAGEATSIILTSAAPKPDAAMVTAGWLTVSAPIPLQVRENGRLIGSTDVDKIFMPSGDHALVLVNENLGFSAERRLKITAGKTTAASVDVPNGSMSLNAIPWADVFVDGERVGQTPIGNLAKPIGRHEVIFRHPDLGERKEYITVTTQQTARLGVDLRKK